MKKIALVTAMALVATAGAQADVTVYGKAALGLDYVNNDNGTDDSNAVQLNSNASRIGLKGSEKLTDTLNIGYKAEYESFFDSGTNSSGEEFTARNIYVTLDHATMGSLLIGRNDTPVKEIGADVDLFNDLNAGNLDDKRTLAGEERASNMLLYSLPKSVPLNIKAGVSLDGATESTTIFADGENDRPDENTGIHAQLGYEIAGIAVNAAYAGSFGASFNGAPSAQRNLIADVYRIAAFYDLSGVKLGALFQIAKPDGDQGDIDVTVDKETAFVVSGKYKIPDTKFGIGAQYQFGTTKFDDNRDDVDIMQYGVIGDYKFTKAVKALGYVANRNTDDGSDNDRDFLVAGTAIEYKF